MFHAGLQGLLGRQPKSRRGVGPPSAAPRTPGRPGASTSPPASAATAASGPGFAGSAAPSRAAAKTSTVNTLIEIFGQKRHIAWGPEGGGFSAGSNSMHYERLCTASKAMVVVSSPGQKPRDCVPAFSAGRTGERRAGEGRGGALRQPPATSHQPPAGWPRSPPRSCCRPAPGRSRRCPLPCREPRWCV